MGDSSCMVIVTLLPWSPYLIPLPIARRLFCPHEVTTMPSILLYIRITFLVF